MRRLVSPRWLIAFGVTICLAVLPASAQPRRSGQADPSEYESPPTVAWVISGLFLAAGLVVVFKNPKRSHQG